MKTEQLKRLKALLNHSQWKFEDVFVDPLENGVSFNTWKSIKAECEKLINSKKTLSKKDLKTRIAELERKKDTPQNRGKLVTLLVAKGNLDCVQDNVLWVAGIIMFNDGSITHRIC